VISDAAFAAVLSPALKKKLSVQLAWEQQTCICSKWHLPAYHSITRNGKHHIWKTGVTHGYSFLLLLNYDLPK